MSRVIVTCFDSCGVQNIPKEIKEFVGNKNMKNIFRIQAYDSTMCEYFCIEFIDFMLSSKRFFKSVLATPFQKE